MTKTLKSLTLGLALLAGSASADARSDAYTKMMYLFNVGHAPIAHDLANCPVYWASESQLFAINEATTPAALDAAMDNIFQTTPNAVICVVEVATRYDLLDVDIPGLFYQ